MNPDSFIALSKPTNRTVQGPLLNKTQDQLVVEYDFEMDGGELEWSRIIFQEVLVFEFRDSACCRADDVVNGIRRSDESTFLRDILRRWQETVGWQDWQQEKGGAERFKHFTMYFDDAASLNVIASSCRIESE